MLIEVFTESDDDRREWYADEESDDPEKVFWEREDQEGDEYRKMYVGRDDFRIEVVGFHSVNQGDHHHDGKNVGESTISISNDDDGYTREDGPEYRDKSENKDNEREGDDKWEGSSTMDDTHNDESEGRHERVDQGYNGLCAEYESESSGNLSC